MDIRKLVQRYRDGIIGIRRDLHRIPEIGFREKETAAYIERYLKKEKLKLQTHIAKTGVVGLLDTGRPGKTLMIRSDMDGLPISEETNLDFASINKDVMHACGHDGHMAMVLGAVKLLNEIKENLGGKIKFVFQPAEEGPGGAKLMISEGVMENPRVDFAVGCHLWPTIPEGKIGIRSGKLMASMSWFDIRIIGKGGHGAMPHLTIDAIDVGVQVVNALQRIVSRKMNPVEPAVLTIGTFNGGSAFNIIADEAVLRGTARTFSRRIWESWENRIKRVVDGVCKSMGAKYRLSYNMGYPPVINSKEMASIVKRCAIDVVGEKNVIEPELTMGSDDIAFFLEKSKGAYFFLGIGGKDVEPLHSSKFNFNEDILLLGVEMYLRIALEILGR